MLSNHSRLTAPDSISIHDAYRLLCIDSNVINSLPLTEGKTSYLTSMLMLHEFNLIRNAESTLPLAELRQAQAVYLRILKDINEQSKNKMYYYSSHSVGIHEACLELAPLEINNPLNYGFIETGKKNEGVEPGFMAVMITDFVKKLRISTHLNSNITEEDRWNYLFTNRNRIAEIFSKQVKHLTKYLFKLEYMDVTADDYIVVDKNDLKRSNTIQGIYNGSALPFIGGIKGDIATNIYAMTKSVKRSEKNLEGILENIGNDLARLYGMQTQEQKLNFSRYPNGKLRIRLKAAWVKNATQITPLAGGMKLDNGNYHVVPTITSRDGIQHLSNPLTTNISEHLVNVLLRGDPDKVGKRGQNALIVYKLDPDNFKNSLLEFHDIDCGHTFAQNAVDLADEDFHVKDNRFSNYSIFYDAPRSSIVKGLLRIAKLSGMHLDGDVVASYGNTFKEQLAKLDAQPAEAIFNDYREIINRNVRKHYLPKVVAAQTEVNVEFNQYCTAIDAFKRKEIAARRSLLDKYKRYLTLSKDTIDVIENLEKLLCGSSLTSLRSEDKKTLLNYLRITGPKPFKWEAKQNSNSVSLIFTFTNSTAFNASHETLESFYALQLRNFGQSADIIKINKSESNKTISVSMLKKDLPRVAAYFSDTDIGDYLHHDDNELRKSYRSELHLYRVLKSFDTFGICAKTTRDGTGRLRIKFENRESIADVGLLKKCVQKTAQDYRYEFKQHDRHHQEQLFLYINDKDMNSAANAAMSIRITYEKILAEKTAIIESNRRVCFNNYDQLCRTFQPLLMCRVKPFNMWMDSEGHFQFSIHPSVAGAFRNLPAAIHRDDLSIEAVTSIINQLSSQEASIREAITKREDAILKIRNADETFCIIDGISSPYFTITCENYQTIINAPNASDVLLTDIGIKDYLNKPLSPSELETVRHKCNDAHVRFTSTCAIQIASLQMKMNEITNHTGEMLMSLEVNNYTLKINLAECTSPHQAIIVEALKDYYNFETDSYCFRYYTQRDCLDQILDQLILDCAAFKRKEKQITRFTELLSLTDIGIHSASVVAPINQANLIFNADLTKIDDRLKTHISELNILDMNETKHSIASDEFDKLLSALDTFNTQKLTQSLVNDLRINCNALLSYYNERTAASKINSFCFFAANVRDCNKDRAKATSFSMIDSLKETLLLSNPDDLTVEALNKLKTKCLARQAHIDKKFVKFLGDTTIEKDIHLTSIISLIDKLIATKPAIEPVNQPNPTPSP